MNIGFMQGRLCSQVDGKIQAFPWEDWETEFPVAQSLNIKLMEWTLDQDKLYDNPLMTDLGRQKIKKLSSQYDVKIDSLTGDCFMQAPFFKEKGAARKALLNDLHAILDASANLDIKYILIPLVDNGSLTNHAHETSLLEGLLPLRNYLVKQKIKIVFESDFSATHLATFIDLFPDDAFGINYDIGNSSALGYKAPEEISSYGKRIDNIHIKDRILGGTTVPLGTGDADFPTVFSELKKTGYMGNFILQTARADDGDHIGAIAHYRELTLDWWKHSES